MTPSEKVRKWENSGRIVDKILIDPVEGYLVIGPADLKTIIRWPRSTDSCLQSCDAPKSVEYILSAEEMYFGRDLFVKNFWRQFSDGEPIDELAFIEEKGGNWIVCRSSVFHCLGTFCEYLGWEQIRRGIWESDIALVPMFEDARTREDNLRGEHPPFSIR